MQELIRICHMTSAHNSNDARIFQKECTSLAKAGYDTYLVARGESREENDVHVIGVGQPSGSRISRMTGFARRVYQKVVEIDADIYHLHDPELLPYGMKLKRKGKKVIFDSHEYYPLQIAEKEYLPKLLRKMVAHLYAKYETHVFQSIDGVIMPCTVEGKNALHGRAKHSAIISNAVKLSDFSEHDYPRRNCEQTICYAGSLTEERGITNLILATFRANARLILAGAISQEYLQRLQQMPEFSCVNYLGIVDYTAVKEIYAKSSIGAQLWQSSGQYYHVDVLGVKVMEYMAMQLPIIVSDTSYMKEIVRRYSCGICVDPMDIDAIANAIIYLQSHPSEACEMGQNGRSAVEQEFSWEVEKEKLLELYRSIGGNV